MYDLHFEVVGWECWRRVGEKERKREIKREKEKERRLTLACNANRNPYQDSYGYTWGLKLCTKIDN